MWDLSFLTRDRTCIPCIGRWILYHWTTREVPAFLLLNSMSWNPFINKYRFLPLFLMTAYYSIWMYHNLFNSSCIDGYSDCPTFENYKIFIKKFQVACYYSVDWNFAGTISRWPVIFSKVLCPPRSPPESYFRLVGWLNVLPMAYAERS